MDNTSLSTFSDQSIRKILICHHNSTTSWVAIIRQVIYCCITIITQHHPLFTSFVAVTTFCCCNISCVAVNASRQSYPTFGTCFHQTVSQAPSLFISVPFPVTQHNIPTPMLPQLSVPDPSTTSSLITKPNYTQPHCTLRRYQELHLHFGLLGNLASASLHELFCHFHPPKPSLSVSTGGRLVFIQIRHLCCRNFILTPTVQHLLCNYIFT